MQNFAQMQYFFTLALHKLCKGNARPTRYDFGDFFLGYRIAQQRVFLVFALRGGLLQLFVKLRKGGVFKLGGVFVIRVSLRLFYFGVYALDFGL